VWPLQTSEALAPLLVALAHIQVALAPISIYRICGPCTWPLHPLLVALALVLAPRIMITFSRLSSSPFSINNWVKSLLVKLCSSFTICDRKDFEKIHFQRSWEFCLQFSLQLLHTS
jgi:hypothetical protein